MAEAGAGAGGGACAGAISRVVWLLAIPLLLLAIFGSSVSAEFDEAIESESIAKELARLNAGIAAQVAQVKEQFPLKISDYQSSQALIIPGINKFSLNSAKYGGKRTYWLYIPSAYLNESNHPLPLAFFFHGLGGDEDQAIVAVPDAEKAGYLFISGTGVKSSCILYNGQNSWSSGACCSCRDSSIDDTAFTLDMLSAVKSLVQVDDSRIFAIGASNGGMMVSQLACTHPQMFRGIVDAIGVTCIGSGNAAGLSTCDQKFKAAGNSSRINLLKIHGTNDALVPWGGSSFLGFPSISSDWSRWQSRDSCVGSSIQTLKVGSVSNQLYTNCTGNTQQEFVTVTGGTHEWYNFTYWTTQDYLFVFFDRVTNRTNRTNHRTQSQSQSPQSK